MKNTSKTLQNTDSTFIFFFTSSFSPSHIPPPPFPLVIRIPLNLYCLTTFYNLIVGLLCIKLNMCTLLKSECTHCNNLNVHTAIVSMCPLQQSQCAHYNRLNVYKMEIHQSRQIGALA